MLSFSFKNCFIKISFFFSSLCDSAQNFTNLYLLHMPVKSCSSFLWDYNDDVEDAIKIFVGSKQSHLFSINIKWHGMQSVTVTDIKYDNTVPCGWRGGALLSPSADTDTTLQLRPGWNYVYWRTRTESFSFSFPDIDSAAICKIVYTYIYTCIYSAIHNIDCKQYCNEERLGDY